MDDQDKPKTGKKGKRGQAEGLKSKAGMRGKIPSVSKKPGRQKQTVRARARAIKKARSV